MADDDLLVTISGPALSLLLYENARCHDQIGFLLGEVQIFRTKKVTDSEKAVENIQTRINIKSVVPHPMGCEPFFNTTGQLNELRLKEFLKEDLKKVVGWYHYRYDFILAINSLRDRTLHTDLSKFFSNLNIEQKQENFLFFLMGTTENETCATHKFKHVLYRKEGRNYKPTSFKINNLGADTSRPDGSDYKPTPQYTTCQFDSFDHVYNQIRNDLKRSSGVEAVQLIEKSAEGFLAKIIPQVNETDKIVSELSQQLFDMRHNYYQANFERLLKTQLVKQMELCSMEVDTQPSSPFSPSLLTKSEPLSPDSPLMIDPPKISPSSSDIRLAKKKSLKQESTDEHSRDPTSSEREMSQIKFEISRSPTDSGDGEWKSVSQRKREYLEASTTSTSSFERKNVRKSPDDTKNS